jgi:H+/gluconate symporter-like permease
MSMDPLWLLGFGVLLVFGGIMMARLPAFLALMLGAYVVGALTPYGFSIISRMSSVTVGETIKSFSVMQSVMSPTGLVAILILAKQSPVSAKLLGLESGAVETMREIRGLRVGERDKPIGRLDRSQHSHWAANLG